jgi:HAD superfamily hydrolase (TIGR01549 family)
MTIKAVFFDVGETLVDETRSWGGWADFLGVPRLTFFACLGAVIERGEHHRRVFDLVAPGLDLEQARFEKRERGFAETFEATDFYPDAIPCLVELNARGFTIGLSGNQPAQAEDVLRELDLPVDFIASSSSWGLEKPDLRFFQKIIEITGLQPSQIAYVGDRLDNDVLPALEAGMVSVFIRRGPWGFLDANKPDISKVHVRLESLAELPDLLRKWPSF